jgi:hypothetical protein
VLQTGKKDPAADCFGVAQSPKLPRGGINVILDREGGWVKKDGKL